MFIMEKWPKGDTRFLRKNGNVTPLFRSTLETILDDLDETIRFWADVRKKPPRDYAVRGTYIVGSILEGNNYSDLDLLLVADKIDHEDFRFVKTVMATRFFVNRPKIEAIDVFFRPYDEFPDRGSFEVTDQVKNIVEQYNKKLRRLKANSRYSA